MDTRELVDQLNRRRANGNIGRLCAEAATAIEAQAAEIAALKAAHTGGERMARVLRGLIEATEMTPLPFNIEDSLHQEIMRRRDNAKAALADHGSSGNDTKLRQCQDCGAPTKDESGAPIAVCESCWDAHFSPAQIAIANLRSVSERMARAIEGMLKSEAPYIEDLPGERGLSVLTELRAALAAYRSAPSPSQERSIEDQIEDYGGGFGRKAIGIAPREPDMAAPMGWQDALSLIAAMESELDSLPLDRAFRTLREITKLANSLINAPYTP